jgi:NADPH:quinone reductase-like Zn-dependent oxidoreductase
VASSELYHRTLSLFLDAGFREIRRPSQPPSRGAPQSHRVERPWRSRRGVSMLTAMKALTQDEYGSAGVLRLDDVPIPTPAPDEVLIRVAAVGVGPEVWHAVTGRPYLVRVMGYGVRRPKARIPGRDVAGTIESVGEDVSDLAPGDEVFGSCDGGSGSLAEYATTRADRVAPKPTNIGFEAAAAIPTSGCTALHGVRDVGELKSGQSVLVIGASGGVGTFAVQIAAAMGAEVAGVCSAAKADLVRSLGVERVIDYAREDLADGAHRYDLILDTAGRRPLSRLRKALAPGGTLVIVGGEGGDRWTGGFIHRQVFASALSPLVGQRLRNVVSKESRDDLLDLKGFVEAGQMRPIVDRTYSLDDAAQALRDEDEGHGRGKKVVVVSSTGESS